MLLDVLNGGLLALKEYVALHVLTCLIPAFLLAGGIIAFTSRDIILKYLGAKAKNVISFPLAAISSIFIAVCSCTVIPVSAGIYRKGGAIAPAFILLWVAPASNLLAVIYTGNIIGYDMAIARIITAFVTAFVMGTVMYLSFRKEEAERMVEGEEGGNNDKKIIAGKDIILLLLILFSLLSPNYLITKGPYLHKVYVFAISISITFLYAYFVIKKDRISNWLKETWWFVKLIFPLLLMGVFIVGVIGKILPQQWIEHWLGGNSLRSSFLATLIGAVSYFATMTEAPFVDTLMKLGMGKGPALALLLSGPGMSLPNMLAIIKVFGLKKASVYIVTMVILATISGWFWGNYIF
ncbi:MAG: permease [Candidatus Atribacteria bacterium]|nr:MAG: permease [Candidatus Atribacteria bacterium]